MDFSARLKQANSRLKSGRVGFSIEERGSRLVLRGIFPPKPGSGKSKPYQQRLATGYRASAAGVQAAEKLAKIVSAKLLGGEFDWGELGRSPPPLPHTIGEWLERFGEEFPRRRKLAAATFAKDYLRPLNQLPSNAPLSVDVLEQYILSHSEPDTRTRKRLCQAFTVFGQFAGLDCDFASIRGRYSATTVAPRDLPTDQEIVSAILSIDDEQWRYVAALMATYGLRNHEAFLLDFEALRSSPVAQILSGKTGQRFTYPLYPEWFEQFGLSEPRLPENVRVRDHQGLGRAVSRALRREGLPFRPYDLRHCWARRAIEFGLDVSLAAQQMGHSVNVHTSTYHHWIGSDIHQRAWAILINNPNRPRPPQMG